MYTNFKLNFFKLLFLGLVITFTTSCDDDDVTPEIAISDIVGSWRATSFVVTNNADAAETSDFIKNGGTIDFTLLSNGGVRTWITIDTFNDEWDAEVTISGNTMTSDPVEGTREVKTSTIVLEGNIFTMTNNTDSFDFTYMGEPKVSATSVARFERK